MRSENHVEGCREDFQVGSLKRTPETSIQSAGDGLVIQTRGWGHDEMAVDEFVAQAVVGQGVEVGAGECACADHNGHDDPLRFMWQAWYVVDASSDSYPQV